MSSLTHNDLSALHTDSAVERASADDSVQDAADADWAMLEPFCAWGILNAFGA